MLNFNRSKRYQKKFAEDANPTEGIVNLVDIMLVFSCGLLVALVSTWSVDLHHKEIMPVEQGSEITQMDQIRNNVNESDTSGSGYEKMGTVLRDPKTGQLYMLEE